MQSSISKPQSWHAARRNRIGGSEVASILGISPYRTAYNLWLEKTGKQEPEDISALPHVVRGVLGEESCRMLLERERLKTYKPKMWNHGLKSWIGASDDGYNVDDNTILEIKCMGKSAHEAASRGVIPPHYLCQVQYNLYVSQAAYAEFISYRPENEEMHVVQVTHDLVEQERIVAAVDHFWLNHVQKNVPPPMTEKDYVTVDRPELEELMAEYSKIETQLSALTERLDEIKQLARPYTATHTHVTTPSGYKLVMGKRDGGYDYKKFIAETGVSTETLKAYKKKDVAVFTIRLPALVVSSS